MAPAPAVRTTAIVYGSTVMISITVVIVIVPIETATDYHRRTDVVVGAPKDRSRSLASNAATALTV